MVQLASGWLSESAAVGSSCSSGCTVGTCACPHLLETEVSRRRWRDEGGVSGNGALFGEMCLVVDRGTSVGEGVCLSLVVRGLVVVVSG